MRASFPAQLDDGNMHAGNFLVDDSFEQQTENLAVDGEHVSIKNEPPTLQISRLSSDSQFHVGVKAESIYGIHFLTGDVLSNRMDRTQELSFGNIPALIGCRTGRPPIQLYLTCDDDSMSQYQCLVRKQIELFEADYHDVKSSAQGRNKPIVLGQVGIRCRHCNMFAPNQRKRGSTYYPSKLDGIYQAANNLAIVHLGEHCQKIDGKFRAHLMDLRQMMSNGGGGKKVWADRAAVLGVFEDENGLRFEPSINYKRRNYI